MNVRAMQDVLMKHIANKLYYYTGIEFNQNDMDHLPEDCLNFFLNRATMVNFRFEPGTFDEDNLDNTKVRVDFIKFRDSTLTIDDIYKLCEAIRAITKEDYVVYLQIHEGVIENLTDIITINKPGSAVLTSMKETDRSTLEILKESFDRGALSVVNLMKLGKIDKKYKDFLLSRGAIDFGKDWIIILDNE